MCVAQVSGNQEADIPGCTRLLLKENYFEKVIDIDIQCDNRMSVWPSKRMARNLAASPTGPTINPSWLFITNNHHSTWFSARSSTGSFSAPPPPCKQFGTIPTHGQLIYFSQARPDYFEGSFSLIDFLFRHLLLIVIVLAAISENESLWTLSSRRNYSQGNKGDDTRSDYSIRSARRKSSDGSQQR